jgi:signal transduction histidine kinase
MEAFSRFPSLRRSARLRLALFYGGLFLVSGVVLLAITNFLVRRATGDAFFFDLPKGGPPAPHRGEEIFTFRGQRVPPALQEFASKVQASAMGQHARDLHQLLVQSGIALAVITVLSFVLGWLVAGRVLRPLRSITARAQRISASNLHERVAIEGADDEFKELGDTLDGLLGRLEASFEAQRHFVANASHELRTPLTLERTLLQLALSDPEATAASLRGTCEELLSSGYAQERLIEGLLTLASSEGGLEHREPVDLARAVRAAELSARAPAETMGVVLRAEVAPAMTMGDPRLIERLVANLLDNALRHNVPGGWVAVSCRSRGPAAVVAVANSGPIIPEGDVERLFEPFQRLDGSRSGRSGGHGLGLAIVKAVAVAHEALVKVVARPDGGLEVEVVFAPPVEPVHDPAGRTAAAPQLVRSNGRLWATDASRPSPAP